MAIVSYTGAGSLNGAHWMSWAGDTWNPGISPELVFNGVGFDVIATTDASLLHMQSGPLAGALIRLLSDGSITAAGNFGDPNPLPLSGTITGFQIWDRYEDLLSFNDQTGQVFDRFNQPWAGQLLASVGGLSVNSASLQNVASVEQALLDAFSGGVDLVAGSNLGETLFGGAGSDTVLGGPGSDRYEVSFNTAALDFISETQGGGTDTLAILDRAAEDLDFRRSGTLLVIEEATGPGKIIINDHYSGIPTERVEFLEATDGARFLKNTNIGTATSDIIVGASANDSIDGAGGNDLIFGGGGNDTLNGGSGDDLLKGGTGNDTYRFTYASSDEDVISEANGGGTDSLVISDESITELGIRRSGNLLVIEDPDSPARIVIEDHFSGIATNRIELVSDTDGTRFFKTGLSGTATDDILVGASSGETVEGGAGDDILVGGGSKDVLIGGTGADVFLFARVSDSTSAAPGRDTISDFSKAEGDRLGLTGIDANTGVAGDNDFVFLGLTSTTGAGTVAFSFVGGNTLVQADVDGGGADFSVLLGGLVMLDAGDFVL